MNRKYCKGVKVKENKIQIPELTLCIVTHSLLSGHKRQLEENINRFQIFIGYINIYFHIVMQAQHNIFDCEQFKIVSLMSRSVNMNTENMRTRKCIFQNVLYDHWMAVMLCTTDDSKQRPWQRENNVTDQMAASSVVLFCRDINEWLHKWVYHHQQTILRKT